MRSSKSPSIALYSTIVVVTLLVAFGLKNYLDASKSLSKQAASNATASGSEQQKHNMLPDEVYAEADFKQLDVTPSEAQGVDSRWETARMVRAVASGFVEGPGSAGDAVVA